LRSQLVALTIAAGILLTSARVQADIWEDPAFSKLAVAIKHYNTKDLKTAEKLCRESLKLYQRNILAHYLLGEILFEKEQYNAAADEFRHATGLYPRFSEGHSKLGLALAALKDYKNARDAFERALAINADNPEALKGIAMTYDEMGDTKQSLKYYVTAHKKLGGKDESVLIALVNISEKTGNPGAAINYLKQLIALHKTWPRVRRLAILNFNAKRHGDALPLLEELAKTGNADANSFYALGMTRHGKGDLDGCLDALQKAVLKDKTYVEARFNLAVVLMQKRMVPKAIKELEEVVKINPKFVRAYETLGLIHKDSRYDIDEANRWYKKAAEVKKQLAPPKPPRAKPKPKTPAPAKKTAPATKAPAKPAK